MGAPSVTLVVMTNKAPARLRALLEVWRDRVDEILAVSHDETTLEAVRDLADERVVVDPGPMHRHLGWQMHRCRTDWILPVEDDEVPAAALLEELPTLLGDRHVTHHLVARRWASADPSRWIACTPWHPDVQARLVRNVPGIWSFPGVLHAPLAVAGARAVACSPLYHLSVALAPLPDRRARRDGHERLRPGLVDSGVATNLFYTPEDVPGVATAPVPEPDRRLVERYLTGATSAPGPPRGPTLTTTLAAADRFSARRAATADAYTGSIRFVDPPVALWTGATTRHVVEVRNGGAERWDPTVQPPLHLAVHWLAPDGRPVVFDGARTALAAPVEPRSARRLPLTLLAPDAPGDYLLQPALVREDVAWFAEGEPVPVTVREGPGPSVATAAGTLPAAVSLVASASRP
jgi:hypothetical protein